MEVSQDFLKFIESHKDEDAASVLLKYGKFYNNISVEDAVTQIVLRRKSRNKIPTFINKGLLFPDSLSYEQATDERVASYHAGLVGIGQKVIDMTAGLGIDAMSIARNGNEVTALELDPPKADFLKRNAKVCGINGLKVINTDSTTYIQSLFEDPDSILPNIIFIDPARRKDHNTRVYALKDCLPDITSFYKKVLQEKVILFIKVSPLLDLTALERELSAVSEFHIVSVKGECKEILIVLEESELPDKDRVGIKLFAIDLDEEGKTNYSFQSKIDISLKENPSIIEEKCDFCDKWLYEPGAAIMKIMDRCSLKKAFPELKKLNKNTSLFISDTFYPDFPGRKLKIIRELYKKDLKSLKGERWNICVRNYPLSAEELRKKLKTNEGTDSFIYGCRFGYANKPILLECEKITSKYTLT